MDRIDLRATRKAFAVYTKFDPWHKYEESLESIWLDEEDAQGHAEKIKEENIYDYVYVSEIYLNSEILEGEYEG